MEASGLGLDDRAPGPLTNVPGTGRVDLARKLGRWGEIPRDDVALVLLHVLTADNTIHGRFELVAGRRPVEEAVR